MAFSDQLDENIKALEAQTLPAGVSDWYQNLDALTSDSKMASLAAWALTLLPIDWQIAAITHALSEDALDELAAWADDMIDTRRGIDGPSE